MAQEIYQEMFDNAVHVGHRTQKWNPLMRNHICAEQNGLHIINLEHTVKLFESALNFLQKSISEGKTVLFVSTKPQSYKLLKSLADKLNMPYVNSKWISGLLTNFDTIKSRIKYLSTLKDHAQSGEFEKYTKKEASKLRKQMIKLEISLGGVQNMSTRPDVVFIVDVVRDAIVVKEASKLKLPIVAFVDTNSDPRKIDYPIPANDDALKSLTYLFAKIESSIGRSSAKAKK